MSDPFDVITGSVDPAMVVVTVGPATQRSGCLVGFHGQASIEPLLYAVWLSTANLTYEDALAAETVAVHFLTADDRDLAELFGGTSGDDVDKLAGCEVEDGPDGVPLLARCPNRLTGPKVAMLDDGGDHLCVTIAVRSVTAEPFVPLRYSAVADIDPGHEPDERRNR